MASNFPTSASFATPELPIARGHVGSVAAAHPLAVAAGTEILSTGGTAADAVIAAQAALCVIMPDACGLGGDMLALLHTPNAPMLAINGAGAAPTAMTHASDDGANSITVPGIVDAWCRLSQQGGRLPLARVLQPAIQLALDGVPVSPILAAALMRQRSRLQSGGAEEWVLYAQPAGAICPQPALATLFERIAMQGRTAFYDGAAAQAIARCVRKLGGALSEHDLATHATVMAAPVTTAWGDWQIAAQPPMTQGILLNMAIQALDRLDEFPSGLNDHVAIELTQAAFAFRDEVGRSEALLAQPLLVDFHKASQRGGPRSYLHTAGVAAADSYGNVVSSLVSVFDDFGSCVFVPELGIVLNNRAGGFTAGANAAAPGKRPVHTLAPILLTTPQGVMALATPGADGQVQTLLQVLIAHKREQLPIAQAIARPRWRSENGHLLIEQSHPGIARLASLGHRISVLADGDLHFGAVVCAGCIDDILIAVADWRRQTAAGAV